MYRRITVAAVAAIATLALTACGGNDETPGNSTTATTSESDQENTVTIGQTIEKMGIKLTLTKVTVNDTCKYGPGYDELKPGMKVIQYEATMENTTAEAPLPVLPTPLNEDGTETVIPRSMQSGLVCMPTRGEDGTVYWHEGVKPNATRKIYQQQVVPDEVTAVRIFGRIFTLPDAATPTTSANQKTEQPNPTEANSAPQEVDAPEVAVTPDPVKQAPVDSPPAPAQQGYQNETAPDPDIPNAMLDATVPNDCDGYLGAHEDPDESHC
ncbi:hypothetical protein [Candidatus Corynebacterium faecigallinarum]|uniref:hypothetical protein n=1 Tax=Candidatus Corynebacterium faecigallinarum TaxID=2838528 RepID=UPI003FD22733